LKKSLDQEESLSDSILMIRVGQGDRSAMDTLVERHHHRLYRFAYRLCRDEDTASDIVAVSLIRAFNSAPSFRGEARFTTWMYRVVVNAFLDYRKKASIRVAVSLDDESKFGPEGRALHLVDPSASPQTHAESSVRGQRIHAAIARLPEYQKVAIVMFHIEGMSYEEMAVALDLPIGTIKSRLNRARQTLADLLSRERSLFYLS